MPEVEQCPPILSRYSWIGTAPERAIECCTSGHQQAAITKNIFLPCDADRASLGDADVGTPLADMLRVLRGRTVAFVGDSTMHQLWTALVADIFALGQPIDVTQRVLEFDLRPDNHNRDDMCTVSHTNTARLGGCENKFRLHRHMSPTCNHTGYRGGKGADGVWQLKPMCEALADLELWLPQASVGFKFFRMDANRSKTVRVAWQRTHGHCGAAKRNFVDKLAAATEASDAVVANVGVWYGSAESRQYRSDVNYILSRLQALPAGKLGLFRESVVQHFPTASGSGLYEEREDASPLGAKRASRAFSRCHTQCAPLGHGFRNTLDWRNAVLHDLVRERGFPISNVVPVASLLRPMAAAHKSTKWKCTLDCTHYCYHPDLWAALLDGVYRRLQTFFSRSSAGGGKTKGRHAFRAGRPGNTARRKESARRAQPLGLSHDA